MTGRLVHGEPHVVWRAEKKQDLAIPNSSTQFCFATNLFILFLNPYATCSKLSRISCFAQLIAESTGQPFVGVPSPVLKRPCMLYQTTLWFALS